MNPRTFFTAKQRSREGTTNRALLLFLCCFAASRFLFAAEPFLQKGDVIALVGGEDMVVAGELSYLEILLTRALPGHRLRFRCLAWEGDTVFEQRRDLNFPPLEAQLDQVGATVVLCQFGQMEALAAAQRNGTTKDTKSTKEEKEVSGKDPSQSFVSSVPFVVQNPAAADSAVKEFIAAYEKLIERMSAGGKRRIVMLAPWEPAPKKLTPIFPGLPVALVEERSAHGIAVVRYIGALGKLAGRLRVPFIDIGALTDPRKYYATRDGVHLTDQAHGMVATLISRDLAGEEALRRATPAWVESLDPVTDAEIEAEIRAGQPLGQLIRAKNRLWFDYWRVQNWAFLAGDRTEQPSSRDHLDRTKRWFPAEREAFLPLIAAKEREIDALAAQLARP